MERWVDRSITSKGIDLHSCSGSLNTSGNHRIGRQNGKIDGKQERHRHQWLKVSNEQSEKAGRISKLKELLRPQRAHLADHKIISAD